MDGGDLAIGGVGAGVGTDTGISSSSGRRALLESMRYWFRFIERCVQDRLDTERFESFARLVYAKHRLPPIILAGLFLRPQPHNRDSPDPRIPPYLKSLDGLGYIDTPATLRALYEFSSCHVLVDKQLASTTGQDGGSGDDENNKVVGEGEDASVKESDKNKRKRKPLRWRNSYWLEEATFYRLTKLVVEGRAVRDTKAALQIARILSQWMALFTAASATFTADLLAQTQQRLQEEMGSSRAGLVALLLRLSENLAFVSAISKPRAKGLRRELSKALASFVPSLHEVHANVTNRLEHFRTEILDSIDPVDEKKEAVDAAMSEILDSAVGLDSIVVTEIPISNTRAGLYVYINASLVGRPLLDDAAFFTYLNNRYQNDVQALAIDLILASFDVLANAVFKNSSKEDAQLLRSFLINKVPLLLYQLCPPQFSTTTAEVCITEALGHVDTSLFPTASLMFDESRNNNPYTESVREEFCAACVLHGLVDREHVERILGEISMGYEPKKTSKDELVQNCLSDSDKIQGLVNELDRMDGNVGAVCHALVELIRQFCSSKDTTSLKLLCTQLVQKPQLLDILLLFERLPAILEPLCQFLDKWKYDDDQAEYQPVYEDFGAVLLLVLAFTYRYNLETSDIGLYSPNSSVRKILSRAHINRHAEDLSAEENKHIGGWIHGLFDSEGGGLGDDLMSSCPPQEFYIIVAPLFYNIVVGYANGYISDEALKGGVEYLVDTFLLPALVPAIKFLADYIWVDQNEQKAIIKVLQLILLPASISSEASAMLASVKKIVARPLEHALRTYQKRDPENQDINPLLGAIKDSLPQAKRIGAAESSDLDSWASTQPNGLASAIRNTIQALAHWSMNPSMNIMPTSYTHRQIIAGAQIMTSRRVLQVILDEIRSHTEAGNANIIYDVAIALVCAPDVSNQPPAASIEDPSEAGAAAQPLALQRRLTLRDALRMEAEDFKKTQKKDAVLAEITLRLHRKVEAQMALPPPAELPQLLQPTDMTLPIAMDAAAEASLNETMAAMGDGAQLDLDLPVIDGLGGGPGGADGDGVGDDFFGLDGNLDDFNWSNDMDLS